MRKSGKQQFICGMRLLALAVPLLLLAACASMGRPEGGPRDEDPPVFLRSDPGPGATNVSKSRLSAIFNENIQLEDAFNKVIVSPAQKTPPTVSANGHRLTVDFRDTLIPNTTYTIDFADAIKDLNEGNILDGFALDFSTGDTIDTLRISGIVLQASNLEPAQGMLVGVYSNLSDTALTTLPFERIARTNQYGQFTIRNLKAGTYRIFAVNDVNRDYHWDRSEDIAFFDTLISPTIENISVTDTLYAADGGDSLAVRAGIRYLPNDILLTWFNEDHRSHYISDYKRDSRRQLSITFGAPADSLPQITIASGVAGREGEDISKWALLNGNETNDTLRYWLSDPDVVAADSLRLAVGYLKTDSAEQLVWTSDTLRFFFRDMEKKKKKKDKEKEDNTPKFTVDSVTGDTTWLPPQPEEWLVFNMIGGMTQDIHKPLRISSSLPIASLDTAAVSFEVKQDSVWSPLPFVLEPDSADMLLISRISHPWTGGERYRITIDSLAAVSIYGPWNRKFTNEFGVRPLEEYSNFSVNISGIDTIQAVVELLNSSDSPQYSTIKPAGQSRVDFRFLEPGTYYMRLILDTNKNGKWDKGSYAENIQPEEVYYFAKKLDLKKNWDVEQTWDVYELPVDAQKPSAIKKNKPKLKRGETPLEEEEEEDGYFDPLADPFDPNYNKNSRINGTNTTNMYRR